MNILYFHQFFKTPSQAGGIRSYEFAQNLIKRGHHVTMVCGIVNTSLNLPPTKDKLVFRGVVDDIDVIQINIPISNKYGLLKRTKTFLQYAFKSIHFAMSEDYDVAFATSTPITAGIPVIWAKWFRHKRYVFEVRDLWPELPKALGLKNPIAIGGMAILEKLSYRNSSAAIGLSPGIKQGIERIIQKDKEVAMIPNGCDLEIFKPGKRADLKLEGISDTDTVAIFTGTHGVANGLDAILDAAIILKRKGRSDIKLCFIGDGKLKNHLIERAENEDLDNCRFYSPVPKVELNKIVASADIGLMCLANVPAFYYGTSPNKFFDYIASGIPVLNNYPGWLADLIKENECGLVVEPNNPSLFAEALIYLADNPELRNKMGVNARKLAEREFGRNMLGNQFVDFIEKVCNEARS